MFHNIPKIMHFYWDGSKLSYLQYLTITSFHKFNPDWRIIIHESDITIKSITWDTPEQKLKYTNIDYYPKLKELEYVEFSHVNFKELGFDEELPSVFKSDFLRWHLLSTIGGGWSDMDILYIKPINTLKLTKNVDTVICHGEHQHIIGFLLSKKDNKFFKVLKNNSKSYFNPTNYQSIGSKLINSIHNFIQSDSIYNMNMNIIYSYNHTNIHKLFESEDISLINDNTIGVHWYNGTDVSKDFNNKYNEGDVDITNGITLLIKKYNLI